MSARHPASQHVRHRALWATRAVRKRNKGFGFSNSKRHNKFLLSALAKAVVYGSFAKAESEISNIVNYKR